MRAEVHWASLHFHSCSRPAVTEAAASAELHTSSQLLRGWTPSLAPMQLQRLTQAVRRSEEIRVASLLQLHSVGMQAVCVERACCLG